MKTENETFEPIRVLGGILGDMSNFIEKKKAPSLLELRIMYQNALNRLPKDWALALCSPQNTSDVMVYSANELPMPADEAIYEPTSLHIPL